MEKRLKAATGFRNLGRYGILLLGIFIFIFSMIMGAEDYGGGVSGLIKNTPNTWPWLVLLLFGFVGWRNDLIGGILIILWGLGLIYFFNFSAPNFWVFTFALTLSIPLLGLCFLLSWCLRKEPV